MAERAIQIERAGMAGRKFSAGAWKTVEGGIAGRACMTGRDGMAGKAGIKGGVGMAGKT
jgi:hypothetical protein